MVVFRDNGLIFFLNLNGEGYMKSKQQHLGTSGPSPWKMTWIWTAYKTSFLPQTKHCPHPLSETHC